MLQAERRLFLIESLLAENAAYRDVDIPSDADGQRRLLRALMNVRPPKPVGGEFLRVQDDYLADALAHKTVTDADSLPFLRPGISLWQGDITTLRCNAIVNAANSGMTGCYVPCHRCIDNAIHTYAGVQLRLACADLMQKQGREEPVGRAKITPAFNLPCRYVLHTVGPMIADAVTQKDCRLLSDCYRACLSLAAENGLQSVAFCCISTGEFRFPNGLAAEIAVQTVTDFLQTETSIRRVIFNVFKDEDKALYAALLGVPRDAHASPRTTF